MRNLYTTIQNFEIWNHFELNYNKRQQRQRRRQPDFIQIEHKYIDEFVVETEIFVRMQEYEQNSSSALFPF